MEPEIAQLWWHIAQNLDLNVLFSPSWFLTCKTFYNFTKDDTVLKSIIMSSVPYYSCLKSRKKWLEISELWLKYQNGLKYVKKDNPLKYCYRLKKEGILNIECSICKKNCVVFNCKSFNDVLFNDFLMIRGYIICSKCITKCKHGSRMDKLISLLDIKINYGENVKKIVELNNLSFKFWKTPNSCSSYVLVPELEQCLFETLEANEIKEKYERVWKLLKLRNKSSKNINKRKREIKQTINKTLEETYESLNKKYKVDDDISKENYDELYLENLNYKVTDALFYLDILPHGLVTNETNSLRNIQSELKIPMDEIIKQKKELNILKNKKLSNKTQLEHNVKFWYNLLKRRGLINCQAKLKNSNKPCSYYNNGISKYCKRHRNKLKKIKK